MATLAAFRSRLDVQDSKRESLEQRFTDQRAADKELWQTKLDEVSRDVTRIALEGRERFNTAERLQRATLKMVASLASKAGADHRTPDDILTRALTEEGD